jgi:hypothetical protein
MTVCVPWLRAAVWIFSVITSIQLRASNFNKWLQLMLAGDASAKHSLRQLWFYLDVCAAGRNRNTKLTPNWILRYEIL